MCNFSWLVVFLLGHCKGHAHWPCSPTLFIYGKPVIWMLGLGNFFFLAQIPIQNKLTKLIISNSSLHYLLLLAALTGRVELESRGCTEVWVRGVVVEQVLKVLGVNCGKVLKCINFGPLYFGTSKTEQIYLYNESPECMDWVAVLEDNAIGGEMVRNSSGFYFSWKHVFISAFAFFISQHASSRLFTVSCYFLVNRLSETSVQPTHFLFQFNPGIEFFSYYLLGLSK